MKFLFLFITLLMAGCATYPLEDFVDIMTEEEKERFFGVVLIYGNNDVSLGMDTLQDSYEDEYSCLVQHTKLI